MKVKSFPLALIVLSFACFQSCSSNDEALDSLEEKTNPQDVTVTLDYTFSESGSLTRAIREKAIKSSEITTTAKGEEIYTNFHKKCLETRQLTPTTYSLTFTNQETGAVAIINGRWDKKDGIRLPEGTYNVSGTSTPKEGGFKEWSDSVYLAFNETVSLNKDDTQLTLTAIYDSFLLMLDAENTTNVSCKCTNVTSSTKKGVPYDDKLFWIFWQKTGHFAIFAA
ncbi:MAG: hypothetical protein IJY31_06100 [Muribaculaceae bacterium]|nr:hypothetical protein [Muribaculaceae bacterium]